MLIERSVSGNSHNSTKLSLCAQQSISCTSLLRNAVLYGNSSTTFRQRRLIMIEILAPSIPNETSLIVYFRSQENKLRPQTLGLFRQQTIGLPRNRVAAHAVLSTRLPDEED